MNHIIALIHEADGVFGISFPDFPGCVSGGDTLEEALERGTATLATHLAFLIDDGDALPPIRGYDDIRRDPSLAEDLHGAIVSLIEIELPGKRVRINVTFDETLLTAVDAEAKREGRTRSDFLEEAVRARLKSGAKVAAA